MQRWEYRVVALREGHYTESLNEYGQDGWELVSVASDSRAIPASETGGMLSAPRALGRLEDAAAKLNKLGTTDPAESKAPISNLLWVLRRPLAED